MLLQLYLTTTGAAKAITKIFHHLEGKIGGCGIRVPVPDGSLTDITCIVKKETTIEEVNNLLKQAADSSMKHILELYRRSDCFSRYYRKYILMCFRFKVNLSIR